jgi:beta-galactosidase
LAPEDKGRAQVEVPYASGELMAISWRGGQEIGRKALATTGAPAELRLKCYRTSTESGRSALGFVTVEVLDAAGQLVSDATIPLQLTISGPVELAAFGSANPRRPASFQSSDSFSYHGRALAILRGTGVAGQALIKISSHGLSAGETAIPVV